MDDFQKMLRTLLENEGEEQPSVTQHYGDDEGQSKYSTSSHKSAMGKASDPAEIIARHLEAQNLEYQKLKAAYTTAIESFQKALGGLGVYGAETEPGMLKQFKPATIPQPVGGQVGRNAELDAIKARIAQRRGQQ